MTYEETLRELYALSARGIEPGLSRVQAALALVGHPERALDVVHVAGTNGKGSVSYGLFHGLGGAVGLFTSPHLHAFTERFRVRGAAPVDRDAVAGAWAALKPILTAPDAPRLTFFETATVMAFWLFRERGVETVVLETGLGGRLDSTNVVARPLACAITRIGLDHTKLLGPDVASIAREKAGILKPGVPAVIAPQRDEARAVIEAVAAQIGAPLTFVAPPLPGEGWRAENARVIAATLELLAERGRDVDLRAGLEARWPGRLERIDTDDGPWLLDAAHNPDGADALAAHLRDRVSERPRVLLFGAMADKEWERMLAALRPEVESAVFSRSALSRAEDPARFAEAFGGAAIDDVGAAMAEARRLAGRGLVVVAGSIFLMADVRARLLGIEADPPIAM